MKRFSEVEWTCQLARTGETVRFRLAPPALPAASFPLIDIQSKEYVVLSVNAEAAFALIPSDNKYKGHKSEAVERALRDELPLYPPLLESRMPGNAGISDGKHRIEFLSWRGCSPFPIVVRRSQAEELPKGLVVWRLGLLDIKAKTFIPA